MDISLIKKANRRVRMFGLVPFGATLRKVYTILYSKPYTLVEYPRLSKAYDLILESEQHEDLPGAIVECGCWNGGYARLMHDVSALAGKERHVWMFDSFDGGPPATDVDVKATGKKAKVEPNGAYPEICHKAFGGVDPKLVHVIQGYFQDTFPAAKAQMGKIAYLHLDADLYESTKYCLEQLWDQLVPGGLVLLDDYTYYLGCQKAVDEFLASKNISAALVKTVQHSAYIRKPF